MTTSEIGDFANALRRMADNADALSERHDIAEVAQLRTQVEESAAQAQRDGDLIDKLRRHVKVMGRSMDAIGRMRKAVLVGNEAVVQIFADALMVIEGPCENFTVGDCRDDLARSRIAPFTAEAWCKPCVARDGLERAGALPAEVDR